MEVDVMRAIKRLIKPVVLAAGGLTVRVLVLLLSAWRWLTAARRPRTAIVFVPGPWGSFGDEAMMVASSQYLKRCGVGRLIILSYGRKECWPAVGGFTGVVDLGDLWARLGFLSEMKVAKTCAGADYFIVLGADMMDGYYSPNESLLKIRYAEIAASLGLDAGVIGFSFNADPHPAAVEGLRKLDDRVMLSVRDPISHRRLQELIPHPVHLCADTAFLLEESIRSESAERTADWIRLRKDAGRIVVGINANISSFVDTADDPTATTIELFVRELDGLFDAYPDPLCFIFIPHDKRERAGGAGDIQLADEIVARLNDRVRAHCFILPRECDASEIKAIGGKADICISARMHFSIACLGAGTPTGAIPYQGKFEGLFTHFQVEGLTLDPRDAVEPGRFAAFMTDLIDRRGELRDRVRTRVPQVMDLARRNFDLLIKGIR